MRIILITGFALDKRAFLPLDLPPDRFQLVDLIPVNGGETLREYALRMGRQLGVTGDDVIGGVSLGGMLALEIAKAMGARGLILIATATHPRHVRKRFLLLAPIARIVPEFLIRKIFTMIPRVLSWQNMLSPSGQALLADIMGHFPAALLKSLPFKIMRWPGCEPTAPVRRLHSEGDWLIRPNGDLGSQVILKGRNHLVTVSHPPEVRRFLLEAADFFAAQTPVADHKTA
jgi:hypothetical protein